MATKKERWDKLEYINTILPQVFPGTDPEKKMKFFDKITEDQLKKLEDRHLTFLDEQADAEAIANRTLDYHDQGLTVREMVVALWEANLTGDQSKIQGMEAKRQAIKAKYPKKLS